MNDGITAAGRAGYLKYRVDTSTTTQEAAGWMAQLETLFAEQCLNCGSCGFEVEDGRHEPRRFLWWHRRPECSYTPREARKPRAPFMESS